MWLIRTAITIDVRPYRELAPDEIEEWEVLAKRVNPPGTARLGSELRRADLDATTDSLTRLREDGELRACAWVTSRTIDVADREVRVAGIRGVATDPDHRHRGFGRAVMERAQGLMCSFGDCEIAVSLLVGDGRRAKREPRVAGDRARRREAGLPEGPIDARGFSW